ncbi:MAG: hypothetical protein HC779_03285 [Phyllobacteriaceae bacterium]|nr:hypothetical protein [Phyllobacteriaceae bacterium]
MTVNLETNSNQFFDAEGDDISEVESIIGSNHNDMLTGTNQANTLSGAWQ